MKKNYLSSGNIQTKLIPIVDCDNSAIAEIGDLKLSYSASHLYQPHDYQLLYDMTDEYMSLNSLYNEAKPHYLDHITKEGEIILKVGITSYRDFLSINRNLDSKYLLNERKTIESSDLNSLLKINIPRPLGVSGIAVTLDNKILFQKRTKSEVASDMFHVSVGEGLCAFKDYQEYLSLLQSAKKVSHKDLSALSALKRGLKEELGLSQKDILSAKICSLYLDEEFMQPIIQGTCKINVSSEELKRIWDEGSSLDGKAEIADMFFIDNDIYSIFKLLSSVRNQGGTWTSHAIAAILEHLKLIYDEKTLTEHSMLFFTSPTLFSMGKQRLLTGI